MAETKIDNAIGINKIDAKEIGLDIKTLRKEAESVNGGESQVMRIAGKISSFEPGEEKGKSWIKFKGYFRAFNHITSEVYQSTKAFLPIGSDEVLAQYNANKERAIAENKPTPELQIAFDYSVKENDFGVGYKWCLESVIPHDKSAADPLETIMAIMKPLPKRLTATK